MRLRAALLGGMLVVIPLAGCATPWKPPAGLREQAEARAQAREARRSGHPAREAEQMAVAQPVAPPPPPEAPAPPSPPPAEAAAPPPSPAPAAERQSSPSSAPAEIAALAPRPAPAAPVAGGKRDALPSEFPMQGNLSQGGLVIGEAPAGTVKLALDGDPVAIAPDGRFLIAFGRDHAPDALLTAVLADGTTIRRPLAIAPRAWEIENLPIPRGVSPSPEFQRIRAAEVAQINAARAILPASDGWRAPFAWPLTGRISGLFGAQRVYNGEKGTYHSGLDIARPTGTPVVAPADGVVILAADHPFTLEGNLLMIDHGMGLSSAFLHLSRIDVKPGEHVVKGQRIGEVGMTGRATGPHLHWSLRWHEERLDPLLMMGPMPGQSTAAPIKGSSD